MRDVNDYLGVFGPGRGEDAGGTPARAGDPASPRQEGGQAPATQEFRTAESLSVAGVVPGGDSASVYSFGGGIAGTTSASSGGMYESGYQGGEDRLAADGERPARDASTGVHKQCFVRNRVRSHHNRCRLVVHSFLKTL